MADQDTTEKKSLDELMAFARQLLGEYPGGFSIAPDGTIVADRQAVDIKTLEEFSGLVREPRQVVFELPGGKAIRLKIRPISSKDWRQIDDMDANAPMPPVKKVGGSPSIARGARGGAGVEELDWKNPEYLVKSGAHYELKRAAIIALGVVDLQIPGETLESRRDFLAEHFPPRILDGLSDAIKELTSNPIERALFT